MSDVPPASFAATSLRARSNWLALSGHLILLGTFLFIFLASLVSLRGSILSTWSLAALTRYSTSFKFGYKLAVCHSNSVVVEASCWAGMAVCYWVVVAAGCSVVGCCLVVLVARRPAVWAVRCSTELCCFAADFQSA